MSELMEIGLDEILFKILERDYLYSQAHEIGLITAQLDVLDYLVLENSGRLENALEVKLEWFRGDLINKRHVLLQEEIKKRMPNAQIAWTALRKR